MCAGKATGLDGIPAVVVIYGGQRLAGEITELISKIWLGDAVLQD